MSDRLALRLHLGALAPLTVSELAEVLGVGESTLLTVVQRLQPLRTGRHKRYLYGEVIEALRDPPPPTRATVRAPRRVQL